MKPTVQVITIYQCDKNKHISDCSCSGSGCFVGTCHLTLIRKYAKEVKKKIRGKWKIGTWSRIEYKY